MNFVFLSPHFPPNYYQFAVYLKKYGATVLGVADEEFDNLNPELQNALTEYYKVDDMHNYDQLVRAMGYFTHKYGKLDRLDSHNEYWLETEAQLRTDFNITGIKNQEISDIKNKSLMKKVYQKAGIDVAQGEVFTSEKQAMDFIKRVGYPIVAKPDIGVGAAETYKINDENEMNSFIQNKPESPYIMEEFITGQIQSYDGIADKDGNIVFATCHEYSQGVMETVNEDLNISYYSLREIPKDLEELGIRTVEAFKVKERFFHLEFFRTPKNRLVALEVNIRPPGGLTTDMFNYANDINIYKQWANVIINNKVDTPESRPYHCMYVGRKANKTYIHSHDYIMEKYGEFVVHNEQISGVFSVALGNYGYLIRAAELDDLHMVAGEIHK
jgi:ATP-grasp domain